MTVNYTFAYHDDTQEPVGIYPNVSNRLSLTFEEGNTWINIVEHFLQFLEGHYGYDIREQVYYSVAAPFNDPDVSRASGREMDRKVFESILKTRRSELIPPPPLDISAFDPFHQE